MSYEEKYRRKIKSVDEVVDLVGSFPREKKVIMCHGTFDVVHPGHLRHMMYAKSKADILIVSLTCDAYIRKAENRPFVPEDLRSINLAAFDMVDHVIVDKEETPLENIKRIQPDFFAKGYEYNADGMTSKTEAEKTIVEEYGGLIMFTPGDIVYSSSKLIESQRPNISYDKLSALMNSEDVTFDKLRDTLKKVEGLNVHVVGDTIIDTYTATSMIGGQTKTPTISVRYEAKRNYVGGAGVVAKHLKAAGANVTFTTVLGDDELGGFALDDLTSFGVEVRAIRDATRPTTEKNAIICNSYRLLKIDTLDNKPVSDAIQSKIADNISSVPADCVVFSDFRHGIFNGMSIAPFSAAIPKKVYRVADSQVASRWGNIIDFQEFDLITPNEREARFSLGDQDSVIRPLALRLLNAAKCKNLILKLGERGIMAYRRDNNGKTGLQSFFVLDSFCTNVVDTVGSGDALLAYACLADCISKDTVIAAILGAMAAACECEHDGNYPISAMQMGDMLGTIEKRIQYQKDDS